MSWRTAVKDYWALFLNAAGPLAMAIGSAEISLRESPKPAYHERWEIWCFWTGVLGAIIGIAATVRNASSITALTKERDALKSSATELQALQEEIQQKYNELCSLHLAALMQRMGMSQNDRISTYKSNGGFFWRIARYSTNPDHARPGRSIYPDHQGCMGAAFREGEAFDESLPANRDSYDRRLFEKWSMRPEEIAKLTMRSRSIAAFALERPILRKRFAIIVFESMSPKSIDDACRAKFAPEERENLIQWLETMERFEPKPTEAKREGF